MTESDREQETERARESPRAGQSETERSLTTTDDMSYSLRRSFIENVIEFTTEFTAWRAILRLHKNDVHREMKGQCYGQGREQNAHMCARPWRKFIVI